MAGEILDDKAIFNLARQIGSPEARAEYLCQACEADSGLRERVQELLHAYEEQASFLESPPLVGVAPTIDELPSESPGTIIGPYKLLQQIGEGGMGTVFMAEQTEPVKRKVALKVIKPGMDSRQVIARFEAERQALAIMDHPNIAKVFDGGTTDSGRPYFVMELVKGVPITEFCDEQKLTPRQRLELFVPVCQAVQHAHQKGIIHRDLKPSNVLVSRHDTTPIVKVIDFGVSKALGQALTDKTLFTGIAQMIGTPLYMSPEQAGMSDLDVDTRSDIYSLGVLLYELLTGTTPFEKERFKQAAYDEIRRIIREEEPPKPSTRLLDSTDSLPSISAQRHMEPAKLTKLVRGELDWIVMKALEKDRTRRYETANGFAADVQRYLAGEAVQAVPPSAGYRFRKFARRNKGPVLAASSIIATLSLLVVGLAVSNRLIADERNQKANALAEKEQALVQKQLALDRVERERMRAESNILRTRIAIGRILIEPGVGHSDWPQMPTALRRRFSQGTIDYYQGLLAQDGDDPSLQLEKAVAYIQLSRVHSSWAEHEEAEKFVRQSIAILEKLDPQYPQRHEYRHQLAWSQYVLGTVLSRAKQPAEAEAAFKRAVDLYEKMIISEGPHNYLVTELLDCYMPLIELQKNRGALEEVERTARRLGLLPVQGFHHARFASMLYDKRLIDETRKQYEDAIKKYEQAIESKADNSMALNHLAWLLANARDVKVRDPVRAVELAKQAVELSRQEGAFWNTLGAAHYRAGDWKAAIAALEKSMELRKGGNCIDQFFLAMAHWKLGEKDNAREWYGRAVQIMDKTPGRTGEMFQFRAEAAALLGVKEKK